MEHSQGTPQDTDMASPPSSFRQYPTSNTSSSASHQQQQQQQPGPESTSQSTPKKQRVPDGYVYQAYYDPSRSRRHRHERNSESAAFGGGGSNHASATRILELRGLERVITL